MEECGRFWQIRRPFEDPSYPKYRCVTDGRLEPPPVISWPLDGGTGDVGRLRLRVFPIDHDPLNFPVPIEPQFWGVLVSLLMTSPRCFSLHSRCNLRFQWWTIDTLVLFDSSSRRYTVYVISSGWWPLPTESSCDFIYWRFTYCYYRTPVYRLTLGLRSGFSYWKFFVPFYLGFDLTLKITLIPCTSKRSIVWQVNKKRILKSPRLYQG